MIDIKFITPHKIECISNEGWGRVGYPLCDKQWIKLKIHHIKKYGWTQIILLQDSNSAIVSGSYPENGIVYYNLLCGITDKPGDYPKYNNKGTTLLSLYRDKNAVTLYYNSKAFYTTMISGECYVYIDLYWPQTIAEIIA